MFCSKPRAVHAVQSVQSETCHLLFLFPLCGRIKAARLTGGRLLLRPNMPFGIFSSGFVLFGRYSYGNVLPRRSRQNPLFSGTRVASTGGPCQKRGDRPVTKCSWGRDSGNVFTQGTRNLGWLAALVNLFSVATALAGFFLPAYRFYNILIFL